MMTKLKDTNSTAPCTSAYSRWLMAFLYAARQAECLGLTWPFVTADTLTIAWQLQPIPYRVPRDRSSGFRVPDGYEAQQLAGRMHLVRPKSKAGWRTTLSMLMLFANKEQRDQAMKSGMTDGMSMSYDRLEAVVLG